MPYDINKKTPRRAIRMGDMRVNVPEPFAEGHPLSESEANVLNQTYAENIRNNISSRVKNSETELDEAAVQAMIDEYVTTYEFGVRAGGGGVALTPVERRVRKIASERVRAVLKEQGYTKKDIGDEAFDEYVQKVIDANPQITDLAESQLKAEQEAASAVDLSGVSLPTE